MIHLVWAKIHFEWAMALCVNFLGKHGELKIWSESDFGAAT